ncbi:hypothetical protein HanIR_Chr15g0733111 [Helianthus annuus]|nr:hypothetical protein HanIR_Chr15g0733111 [Helianthus annuus]
MKSGLPIIPHIDFDTDLNWRRDCVGNLVKISTISSGHSSLCAVAIRTKKLPSFLSL